MLEGEDSSGGEGRKHWDIRAIMGFFSSKTPQEILRENKRMLDRNIREIDRERMALQAQEKRTVAEMKKLAKAGQEVRQGLGPRP